MYSTIVIKVFIENVLITQYNKKYFLPLYIYKQIYLVNGH